MGGRAGRLIQGLRGSRWLAVWHMSGKGEAAAAVSSSSKQQQQAAAAAAAAAIVVAAAVVVAAAAAAAGLQCSIPGDFGNVRALASRY